MEDMGFCCINRLLSHFLLQDLTTAIRTGSDGLTLLLPMVDHDQAELADPRFFERTTRLKYGRKIEDQVWMERMVRMQRISGWVGSTQLLAVLPKYQKPEHVPCIPPYTLQSSCDL